MNRLSLWRQPTLLRRVMLALLSAAALIWLVLMAYYYWQESRAAVTTARQQQRGDAVLTVLNRLQDSAEARQAARFYAELFNSVYERAKVPQRFFLQLTDQQGQTLYCSAETICQALRQIPATAETLVLNTMQYQLFRGQTNHWRLIMGEPRADASLLLANLSSNLSISVLIALPILLLTVWFAVARGLKPLQQLSGAIAVRNPDDLQPLSLQMTYAELAPLQQALNRLFAQLGDRLAREQQFVQDAAHELRTPLAVMAAQAHVLMRADGSDERQQAGRQLEQAIARSAHLIEQLLDLARIDTASMAPQTPLDLAASLRQAMADVAPAALARQLDLALNAPDQLQVQLDALAWQSVVQNLLNNAVRYTQAGGHIELSLSTTQSQLRLTVADDGPGIAAAELPLIFERFYRVAGTDIAGTGLGLAIVKQAVTRLHGNVRLEPGLQGRGCCFVVEIPLPPGAL